MQEGCAEPWSNNLGQRNVCILFCEKKESIHFSHSQLRFYNHIRCISPVALLSRLRQFILKIAWAKKKEREHEGDHIYQVEE